MNVETMKKTKNKKKSTSNSNFGENNQTPRRNWAKDHRKYSEYLNKTELVSFTTFSVVTIIPESYPHTLVRQLFTLKQPASNPSSCPKMILSPHTHALTE